MNRDFACRISGLKASLVLQDDGATAGERILDWLDVDDVQFGNHSLTFVLPDATTVETTHLGARFDECTRLLRELRGRARRAALTQSALAPLQTFESRHRAANTDDWSISDILVFPHAVTIEPRGGPATVVPLPLIHDVERDGWVFTLRLRGLPDAWVQGLGPRTDEFELRLSEARMALARATSAAFTEIDPLLADLPADDGWAVDEAASPESWAPLHRAWLSMRRADCAARLASRTDLAALRMGLWTEGGTTRLPFLLACIGAGESARTAVEAVDADDRATFVFATDDIDRLNAVLILTAFRREALTLPDDELGRWAVAVRTQAPVQWARERLVARIVHDARWAIALDEAMA